MISSKPDIKGSEDKSPKVLKNLFGKKEPVEPPKKKKTDIFGRVKE